MLLVTGMGLAQEQQQQSQGLISEIVIHGNRRIPADTIRARIYTRPGDVYDEGALERDFNSLWNTGFFEDLRFEREQSAKGWIIHIYVKEKPTIRHIEYKGLSSVSQSDVLDRFKDRKVGLTVENQYDPTKVKKAEVVLKELLAEHGRQFANVTAEVHPIPPAAVEITMVVNEGPKVKVGKIRFTGNKHLSSRYLRAAMKNLRPIGIPHSIFLENLISKTYDASKLSEDAERVRDAYQQKGYFKALVEDPQTKIHDTHSTLRVPFVMKGSGKAVDITMPIEEGDRYKLKEITFTHNKAIGNARLLRAMFPMKDGQIFDTSLVRKGLDNLRKAYGQLGYINFTSVPDTEIDDTNKLITLKIDVDEGKPYFVRRIEFEGNTTTRDKVIRREIALQEGQVYNSQLWELSLLRLNQLGYFEQLKPDQDSEIHQNNQEGTVDITLKVKEKGKNTVGLTGGVSGLAGSFIGLNYTTNNFLGLGETLSIEADVGNQERNFTFGFTEPYLFDRPLQAGFTVYNRRYNFNQAKAEELLTGQTLNLPQQFLGALQNFTQSSTGFTLSGSYALHRSFKRVGLTYSFDNSSVSTFSSASQQLFETIAFRSIAGPNALEGVITSKLIPSMSFSTIDNPQRPHGGQSFYAAAEFAGIGGNVRDIRPILEYKRFIPMRGFHPSREGSQTLGFRVLGSFVTGYAGLVANPIERSYLGGDTDLRGFDVRAVSPIAFLLNTVNIPLQNPDGSFVPVDPSNPRRGTVQIPIPTHTIVFPGGDTSVVSNLEYRIPIIGPVTLAPFLDFGMDFIARNSQLRLASTEINTLNNTVYGCTLAGCLTQQFKFSPELLPVPGTNYTPRASTGLELQVLMPVINAPLRVYWAYNFMRLNTTTLTPNDCVSSTGATVPCISRSMFPPGGAGDFTFQQALSQFAPFFRLKEPSTTFRFTVSTTF